MKEALWAYEFHLLFSYGQDSATQTQSKLFHGFKQNITFLLVSRNSHLQLSSFGAFFQYTSKSWQKAYIINKWNTVLSKDFPSHYSRLTINWKCQLIIVYKMNHYQLHLFLRNLMKYLMEHQKALQTAKIKLM